MKKISITTLEELKAFACAFLKEKPAGKAIGLSGSLGAGKTTFVRTLIEELSQGKNLRVPSPTYVLHTRYPRLEPPIEHFDLYRLEKASSKSLAEIGYYEALEMTRSKGGILFVEWPEKALMKKDLELAEEWRFLLSDGDRWVERGLSS